MRRRVVRRRAPNRTVLIVQILMLIGLLVAILMVRNRVGESAGKLLEMFGPPEDIAVEQTAPGTPQEADMAHDGTVESHSPR